MQYRTMKSTGDKLSILGFGCMRLPRKGIGIDEERAVKQIRSAIDQGVNYLDTALLYPGSEALVGKALADGYREKVKLATKLPPAQVKKTEDMEKLLDVQLQKLQTDHIDYYLFHSITASDWKRLKDLGAADFVRKARADGRIRHIGFSTHSGIADFKQIVDDYAWDFCQIQYNILDETNQAGKAGLEYAAARGLGVVIMEPLRGGSLARAPPKEIQAIWDEAEVKRSPAEWALRWVWDHPEVTVVLSGMNDEKHIEENLRAAGEALPRSLSAKEIALVNRVKEAYRKKLKVGCTGCQYCMPCPAGVNIPGCFESYNNLYLGSPLQTKIMYMNHAGGGMDGTSPKALASQCIGCGKCVKKCTQHIDIPAELKQAAKELEGLDVKLMALFIRPLLGAFMRFSRWSNVRKARAK
ncbi:aldo/keto reductase [Methanocella arvoryzae]|uniref:Aldo/keto reductase n=1 Tax=Methanocella arvoryzae (strain DSM 22066 / NBRC 105507 / MRE50) TaxID=351160 RepID=Q0W2U7_METAR|nr:aldo/keto reductase [Methanocella arvoryzae]CAJ37296.1 putative aldo/keto reductase [Methanocella arvoryzae MRE50]